MVCEATARHFQLRLASAVERQLRSCWLHPPCADKHYCRERDTIHGLSVPGCNSELHGQPAPCAAAAAAAVATSAAAAAVATSAAAASPSWRVIAVQPALLFIHAAASPCSCGGLLGCSCWLCTVSVCCALHGRDGFGGFGGFGAGATRRFVIRLLDLRLSA